MDLSRQLRSCVGFEDDGGHFGGIGGCQREVLVGLHGLLLEREREDANRKQSCSAQSTLKLLLCLRPRVEIHQLVVNAFEASPELEDAVVHPEIDILAGLR